MEYSARDYTRYMKEHIPLKDVCARLDMRTQGSGEPVRALCPFHSDRHPSLYIYQDHYHCYSCQAHGDMFALIQQVKGVDYQGAVKWVEEQFPFVKTQKPARRAGGKPNRSPILITQEYYAAGGAEILRAGADERGYTLEFLKTAEVYGTNGHVLCARLSSEEQEGLLEAQLIQRDFRAPPERPAPYQDYFFTPRLVFLIRDAENNAVGFAGRSQRAEDTPKYLYTKGLPKDRVLYRLNAVIARNSRSEKNGEVRTLYLTEGLFDTLRLESLGMDAAGILGSRLSDRQLQLLERFVRDQRLLNRTIELACFLDSDKAGTAGAYELLKAVWRSDELRYTPLKVILNPPCLLHPEQGGKDPDELFRGETAEKARSWIESHALHPLEFLLRYIWDPQTMVFSDAPLQLETQWSALLFRERVRIMNQLSNLFSRKLWKELLEFYAMDDSAPESRFVLEQLVKYLRGRPEPSQSGPDLSGNEGDAPHPYSLALEMARTGYGQEFMPLDPASWDRMHAGIDLIERYYNELLGNSAQNRGILRSNVPLLAFYMPKDADNDRLKALPSHEALLVQHYLLNELLQEDAHAGYAQTVPAVRYDPRIGGLYTTGLADMDVFADTPYQAVSFAYQVDMPVLRRERLPTDGVFRHYYECWKDFINFLQEGVDLLDAETIYRAKLDIRGYYDNIQKHTVRNVLTGPLAEALGYSQNRFHVLDIYDDRQRLAETVMDLLLEELFGWSYTDPQSGEITPAGDPMVGIPQGPALSAYAANILLFPLDRAVSQYVNQVNAQCGPEKIQARYARYVDDMVLLAASPDILLEMERIIHEQLYALGLELSPKTDSPDAVDKEEVRWWLTDKRGGFGVSAAQLAPEDTLDELWALGYEPYSVDRRDALKLLKGAGDILDAAEQERFEGAYIACFKTEEIRYRDAVRLAAFLLEHLDLFGPALPPGALYGAFAAEWARGREEMGEVRSLLSRADLGPMVFLDALLLLLERRIPLNSPAEEQVHRQEIKRRVAIEIAQGDSVKEALTDDTGQGKNAAFLRLRVIQLEVLALPVLEQLPDGDKARAQLLQRCEQALSAQAAPGLQHYLQRWQYMLSERGTGDIPFQFRDFPLNTADELQLFHYVTARMGQCTSRKHFEDLGSLFLKHTEAELHAPGGILRKIERLWFTTEDTEEQELAEAALKSLGNFLQRDYMPAVVKARPALCRALFSDADEERSLRYLPVPPAVDYPGIFAVDSAGTAAFRADFSPHNEGQRDTFVPGLGWKPLSDTGTGAWALYRAGLDGAPWEPLTSPLPRAADQWGASLTGTVADLYEALCGLFDGPHAGLLLSKEHVFHTTDGTYAALTYRRSGEPSGVAVSGQSAFLKWRPLDAGPGRAQRAAALLLEDLLGLKQYPTDSGTAAVLELLSYGLNRLTGRRMQKYLSGLSEASFRQTVQRTVDTFRRFAQTPEEDLDAVLLETALTDRLMAERMSWGRRGLSPGEDSALLNLWAVKSVQEEFPRLEQVLSRGALPPKAPVPLRRVTAAWRGLGCRLLAAGGDGNETVHALGSAALMAAVCHDVRTRVLECVWALNAQEIERLQDAAHTPPIHLLHGQGSGVALIRHSVESVEMQADRLRKRMQEYNRGLGGSYLEQITPAGWYLLLAWVLELDHQELLPARLRLDPNAPENWGNALKAWNDLGTLLFPGSASAEAPFPYDGLAPVLQGWTLERTDQILQAFHLLDGMLGFRVCQKTSRNMLLSRGERRNGQIRLRLDTPDDAVYPTQFAAFFRDSNQMPQYEEMNGQRVWTQTMLGERVLSVSAITQGLAALVQESGPAAQDDLQGIPAGTEGVLPRERPIEDEKADVSELVQSPQRPEPPADETGTLGTKRDEAPAKAEAFRAKLDRLRTAQRHQWRLRKNPNATVDRIALFQFDVDDSYTHPLSECCVAQGEVGEIAAIKKNPTLWDSEKAEEHWQSLYSCAEYRRRALLRAVFFACDIFDVELLLLPEYSIRPETTQWIVGELQQKKYRFSVWAGTCRLAPGRKHEGDFSKLNNRKYDYSAPLPVICGGPVGTETGHDPTLLLERFKKYPAISMEELINPQDQLLVPIMKHRGTMFGDARDDVIELICAEVFLATNPGNITAFAQVYDSLRQRFAERSAGMRAEMRLDLQRRAVLEDILSIGSHTSLVQLKKSYQSLDEKAGHGNGRYGRTPILLVPAYTTRTVDYFVSGQAGYLATSLTTVFCNAAGLSSRGESCFIGTDCWEKDGGQKELFLPDYSLYHGATPGIYHQYDTRKGHGALGQGEQALLICDINPSAAAVGKPRPESMLHPLTLVAHLPVIEAYSYESPTKAEDGTHCGPYERCRCTRAVRREDDPKDKVLPQLAALADILDRFTLEENSRGTTAYDTAPGQLYRAMFCLGDALKSPGLKERAKKYLEFHRHIPHALPPATMLDWLWVEMDYPQAEQRKAYYLDVPAFCETKFQVKKTV